MSTNKAINIVIFGIGNVGSTLVHQLLAVKDRLEQEQQIIIKIPILLNSKLAFFTSEGISNTWKSDFEKFSVPYKIQDIIDFTRDKELQNLIAIDATASEAFVQNYIPLIQNGFHIVAANKVANSLSTDFYEKLRKEFKIYKKQFLYETNVGAGLPIIQTLQALHNSGENVQKVRGVFSGSLSYIFNTFSEGNKDFDAVLRQAQEKGLTEPDPRIDLSGKDVGRKLLILARELNLKKEFTEIKIEDLVPKHLNGSSSLQYFNQHQKELNRKFHQLKSELKKDEVIRHIGELDVATGSLEVKLVKEKKSTALGSLKNADSSFEIYTESYGEQPLVIQGAGAGAAVTARGVLADIVKLSSTFN